MRKQQAHETSTYSHLQMSNTDATDAYHILHNTQFICI